MNLFKNYYLLLTRNTWADIAIMAILICYPALLLTVKGSIGVMFVLLLFTLVGRSLQKKEARVFILDRSGIIFSVVMSSPTIATLLSQIYQNEFDLPAYDWAVRFLLAIPIYIGLRQFKLKTLAVVQFGFPLGTLVALGVLLHDPFIWAEDRYTTSSAFNLIHFSDTTLIIGFLSLMSIDWLRRDHFLIKIFKISGFMAGIYLSIQTGERGSWIAIPVLFFIWLMANQKGRTFFTTLGIALMVTVGAMIITYQNSEKVHQRANALYAELTGSSTDPTYSSIGTRIILWKISLRLFIEHPIFGIGPNGFTRALTTLQDAGTISPYVATMGHAETHNEILQKCVTSGSFGLFSILSVFLYPLFVFFHATKSQISDFRIAGYMGGCFTIGFFIFGLTVEIFNLKMTATFFALTVTVLMAVASNRSTQTWTASKIQ